MVGDVPAGFYSVSETAAYGHVSRQAVFSAIYNKKLKATKINGKLYVKREDYDEYRLHKYSRRGHTINGENVFDLQKGKYSVSQVAKVFSHASGRFYDKQRLYYLIHTGQLKAHRIGSLWVIDKEDAIDLYDRESGSKEVQLTFGV